MSDTAVSSYFLRTKLYRPFLPEDYITRPLLLTRLEKIGQRPLTLLTAPAGYGKTTSLSAWSAQTTIPCAWVSLDEGDNDLTVFLGYLVAAVQSIFPHFGAQILKFAQASRLPPSPEIARYLANEIDQVGQDFVLVLDDFHAITAPEIHTVLAELLHLPPRPLHLVLLSRHDPPIDIARLRAQRQVTEISARDLSFSRAEVADFTTRTLPTVPDEATITILAEKTEGWPVGLRLATIALRQWGIGSDQPAVLQVENRYVVEFLVNEVLVRQPTAVQNFLLKSSILDRFCAPLCAAMLGEEVADAAILRHLEQEGLFIESLDSQNQWVRYHQLFRSLLRRRLDEKYPADEINRLHRRASVWLAANGLIEDAIDHALLGQDVATAVDIFVQQSYTLVNQEQWLLLESLLNKFPATAVETEPKLWLMLAWLYLAKWRLDQLETIRERLAAYCETAVLPPTESAFLRSSCHLFASIHHNWAADFANGLFHARAALAAAEPDWSMLRGYAWIHLATALHSQGSGAEAIHILRNEEGTGWLESVYSRVRKQLAICYAYWYMADLPELRRTAIYGLKLAESAALSSTGSAMHMMAGSASYQQNDLETAVSHFDAVLALPYVAHPMFYVMAAIHRAQIYQAQNQLEAMQAVVETAVQFCQEMDYPSLLFTLKAFQSELALRQGDQELALYWAAHVDITQLPIIMPNSYQPQLVPPKIWLAQDTPASRQQAEAALAWLHEAVFASHNRRYQIEVLALQALLYQAQGKMLPAAETVVQALQLARPGGFIRVFVDLGPKMAVLLKRLLAQGQVTDYIQQILAAFPADVGRIRPSASPLLVESLTDRELDVLRLLAQRLSNKEIASDLVIAPETVKRHTINIYQKLGVENRRQAVNKAAELGLLVNV